MAFIPLPVFANNPSTTVSSGGTTNVGGVSGTAETWTVASSSSFPAVEIGAQQFHVADPQLPSELITVQNVSGTTWTVLRGGAASGQDATTPVAHTAGFTVVQVVSAGDLAGMQYPPWQFSAQAYGAQGDGKVGIGGTGASGQAVLTDAGASFVNATAPAGDVGKYIVVNQGTGSNTAGTNPFCGTIISVNSATSITLSANLGSTCTAAPYVYGTDDSAAINAAVLAASQWAVSTGNYKAQVMFEPCIYVLGALIQSTTYGFSPFNTGVNYTYNTHIAVPFTTQYSRKLVIDFIGAGDSSDPDFWGATYPSMQGTTLMSAVFPPSQPDATYGQMGVLSTPSTQANIGTGGITFGGYANVLINVNGVTICTPYNSQQYAFNFSYAAQANVQNAAAICFAPVNYNSQAVGGTWISSHDIPSNGVSCGLSMPYSVNNNNCNVGLYACEGFAIGVIASEHFTAQRLAINYCHIAFQPTWTPAGTIIHGASILYFSAEGCDYGLYSNAGATVRYPMFVGLLDTEVINSAHVSDASGNFTGKVYWGDPSFLVPGVTGAANLEIINTVTNRGPWGAAPAAPSSTTTQQNTAYRHATIYLSATTGITVVTVGPVTGTQTTTGLVAANGVTTSVRVPSGHWYSVTYGGTLTTHWVLD